MGVSGIFNTIPDKICLVGEQNVAVTWRLIKTIAGFKLAAHIFTFKMLNALDMAQLRYFCTCM
jgi:hypothetical protein